MLKLTLFVALFGLLAYFEPCAGHGMLLEPPGRSSRWRYDHSAPANYDDSEVWCGGVHQPKEGGNCGMCGDGMSQPRPRANELGGRYGQGVIVGTYPSSSTVTFGAKITANHKGFMRYELCNLDEFGGVESEECYSKYRLRSTSGSDQFDVGTTLGMIYSNVVLPQGLRCNHCALRWTYIAANHWGICEDGTGAMGCGPSEWFRSCADIQIK